MTMEMYKKLIEKRARISVIGMGYVGMPLALEFAKQFSVVGFDLNEGKLESLRRGVDPTGEFDLRDFGELDILYTSDPEELRAACFHIVAVPTPIDDTNNPDLTALLSATHTLAGVLKKGDYVVYESTVYPGATEEDCVPVLEAVSGLKYREDFKVGYSPERINPGDKVHTLRTVVKIVSGCDQESLEMIASVYDHVVDAGLHRASGIRVAEAAKIIENTQRDVNIALMNELSIIFNRMGINTFEVIEAAGTKWNFLHFYPGLVGGHCIGVDPYYLAYKARKFRYHPQVINAGRFVNDSMGFYVAKQTVKHLIGAGKNVLNSRVLIMGVTFKENVADIRNSKVMDIVAELQSYGVRVDLADPHADSQEMEKEYGFGLISSPGHSYDALILAVAHEEYKNLDEAYFLSLASDHPVFIDVKGIYRGKIRKMFYWSL